MKEAIRAVKERAVLEGVYMCTFYFPPRGGGPRQRLSLGRSRCSWPATAGNCLTVVMVTLRCRNRDRCSSQLHCRWRVRVVRSRTASALIGNKQALDGRWRDHTGKRGIVSPGKLSSCTFWPEIDGGAWSPLIIGNIVRSPPPQELSVQRDVALYNI